MKRSQNFMSSGVSTNCKGAAFPDGWPKVGKQLQHFIRTTPMNKLLAALIAAAFATAGAVAADAPAKKEAAPAAAKASAAAPAASKASAAAKK
jgi:hypothetical protein